VVGERAVRQATFVVPDDLPDEAAIFLEPAACVLRGIRHARLAELAADKTPPAVVVLGAGSMGLLHLLVLKALLPAVRVAMVEPLKDRRVLARRLGANVAAAPDKAYKAVARISRGCRADVVFDTVGGSRRLREALALLREGGTTVLFAHASGYGQADLRANVPLDYLFKNEQKIVGTYSGSLAEQREIWRLLVEHRLDPTPLVTHHLPLSRFAEAVALAEAQQALKVLLSPDPEPA